MSSEFHSLLADYFDGDPDEVSLARLRDMLAEDAELRDLFRREARLQVLLREAASEMLAVAREEARVTEEPVAAITVEPLACTQARRKRPSRRKQKQKPKSSKRRPDDSILKYVFIPLAAAAVILLLLNLFLSETGSDGDRRSPRVADIDRVDTPDAPDTPDVNQPPATAEEPVPEHPIELPEIPEEPETPVPAKMFVVDELEADPPATAEEPQAPSPAPEPIVADKPDVPSEKPAVVAKLESMSGRVFVFTESLSTDTVATAGQDILEGQTVLTSGAGSSAVVGFADSTQFAMKSNSEARCSAKDGKRIFLGKGELVATVTKQPRDKPMFVTTPHAEVKVLGTIFTLGCDADSTRIRMDAGLVKFKSLASRAEMKLPFGFRAVATKYGKLAAEAFLGPNMLTDADFERNAQGWQALKGRVGRPVVAMAQAHSGKKTLEIPVTTCSPCAVQYLRIQGGKTYEVIGWMKTENAEAELAIVWRKPSGLEYWGKTVIGKVKGTTGWTRIRQTVTAPTKPADARTVKIMLGCSDGPAGTGSVWFDDLYFGERLE